MDFSIENLAALPVAASHIAFRDEVGLAEHLAGLESVDVSVIGSSREGRDLYGVVLGSGPLHVSIIAGSHADEPVGPMTAQALPGILTEHFPELLERFRFHIVVQMNPDGAERNRAWFRDPLDLGAYLEHVIREKPGNDIEFGFGAGEGVRPECRAAQDFLAPHAPFVAHFSLHGMGFAEGAWCLISPNAVDRAKAFMDDFTALCKELDVEQHDVDRKGEKGFTRIREGYCTTPNSVAMKEHFLQLDDLATADLFMPSSMEWVRSLGGDPVCMVSELPLFSVGKRSENLEYPRSPELKNGLRAAQAGSPEKQTEMLGAVMNDFRIEPMALDLQVRLQVGMIVLALTDFASL